MPRGSLPARRARLAENLQPVICGTSATPDVKINEVIAVNESDTARDRRKRSTQK